jgi:3-phenylpropionate/trans-cinnamate dioxygenase ferredoxin subunit
MTQTFHPVCASTELAVNSSKAVSIGDNNILLCNAGGEFYAIDNMCTHQRSELAGGRIRNCFISCPLHGARFNLRDGVPKGELTKIPLKTYQVRVTEEQMIEIAIEA